MKCTVKKKRVEGKGQSLFLDKKSGLHNVNYLHKNYDSDYYIRHSIAFLKALPYMRLSFQISI